MRLMWEGKNSENSRQVKCVEIILENCSSIQVPVRYFNHLYIEHLSTNLSLVCNQKGEYKMDESIFADYIAFELIHSADRDARQLEGYFELDFGESDRHFFKRLNRRDITQMTIIYDDETSLHFLVPWENTEANEYTNLCQTVNLLDNGNLSIVLKKMEGK